MPIIYFMIIIIFFFFGEIYENLLDIQFCSISLLDHVNVPGSFFHDTKTSGWNFPSQKNTAGAIQFSCSGLSSLRYSGALRFCRQHCSSDK